MKIYFPARNLFLPLRFCLDLDMIIHVSLRSSCLNSLSSVFCVLFIFFYLFWYSSVWLANAPPGFNDTTRKCSNLFLLELDMLSIFLSMVFYIFRRGFHISHMCFIPPTPGFRFSFHPHSFPLPSLPFPATSHMWALACGYVCVYVTSSSPLLSIYSVEDLGA